MKKLFLLLLPISLAACGTSMQNLPDGRVLAMTTVSDTLDRSASLTAVYERGPDGRLVQVAGELATGPTVAGQAIAATVPVVTGGLIQGANMRAAARTANCGGQGCGPSTVVVNNAVATANAAAVVDTDVQVVAPLPCLVQGTCANLAH